MKTRDLWLAAENQVRNRFSKVFNLPFLYPAVERAVGYDATLYLAEESVGGGSHCLGRVRRLCL